MRYTTSEDYDGMGEFLFRKWMDGAIEADDEHRAEYGGGFAQFGRRVIEDVEGLPIEYTCFDSISEACNYVAELHDARGPEGEMDGIVAEGRDGFYVSLEGVRVRREPFATRDEAVRALAQAMVDAGCFPDAFYVNERGDWHRIDYDVRELHDDGGDKMREDVQV